MPASKHLATYLNDHLAGSVTALELLEYLAADHPGTDLEHFANDLHAEITADRKVLEALMARLDVTQSIPRKASAWAAEKLAQLKLRIDDSAGGDLRLLETAEGVSLGIEGKRLLWRSLSTAAEHVPELRGPDYADLIRRAEEQRASLEAVRLQGARAALAS